MSEYIDRKVVLNILASKNAPWDGYQKVADLRIADVVSKAAYDQVAWERNLAEEQLKSIGKSLGEKMDDVQPVVHGEWLDLWIEDEEMTDGGFMVNQCSVCKDEMYYGRPNYCPNCGARMDGET